MKTLLLWAALTAAALTAPMAAASPIDLSGYTTRTTLLDASGGVFFDAIVDFFVSEDAAGTLRVDSFLATDPTNASLDFIGLPTLLSPATGADIMPEIVQILFESGSVGYLFTVDVTGQGLDFTSQTAFFNTDATVKLEQLGTTVVPLPAAMPLMLAALAAVGGIARRTRRG